MRKTDFGISEFKSIAGKKGLGAGWIRLFLLVLDQYRVFDKPLSLCFIASRFSASLPSCSGSTNGGMLRVIYLKNVIKGTWSILTKLFTVYCLDVR
jgi:hypothetical protein